MRGEIGEEGESEVDWEVGKESVNGDGDGDVDVQIDGGFCHRFGLRHFFYFGVFRSSFPFIFVFLVF